MNKYLNFEKVSETTNDGGNPALLAELEKRFKVPLFKLHLDRIRSGLENLDPCIIALPDEGHFGFVVPFDSPSNQIKKVLHVMRCAIRIRRLIEMRVCHSQLLHAYGIYPSIATPITVFQLDSPAEFYANEFILPSTVNGISGLLRRTIMLVTSFHPSIAGIILLYRKIH